MLGVPMLHIMRNTVVLQGPSEETLNKADEVGVVTRWVWSLLYCCIIVNVVPTVYNNMNVTNSSTNIPSVALHRHGSKLPALLFQ